LISLVLIFIQIGTSQTYGFLSGTEINPLQVYRMWQSVANGTGTNCMVFVGKNSDGYRVRA
jgi:hypothetical protein